MSIKLTKRIAAEILGRGVSSIKITAKGLEDSKKAITREDVRKLIKDGSIYAEAQKHNKSLYSKPIITKKGKIKRRRGVSKRRGTKNARSNNRVAYEKRIRALRRILLALKKEKIIDNERFKKFYKLARGGMFATKGTMLNHIKESGINIDDEKMQKLKHI
ncbi:MAG: 50S ribosomal protein L19e [Candidatus Micrarchaeia archaeon]